MQSVVTLASAQLLTGRWVMQSLLAQRSRALVVRGVVKSSRRRFIKLLSFLSLLPLARGFGLSHATLAEQQLGNIHTLVDGWILKKSDLVD